MKQYKAWELLPEEKVYLKSEADKVIAELNEQFFQLQDTAIKLDKKLTETQKQIRRHKYKRCLAMASNCRLRARWFGDNAFYINEQWALQWHRRWLELAEKFKEAK